MYCGTVFTETQYKLNERRW